MKFLVFCVLALVAMAAARPDDDHYNTKYDNINIEELIGNVKLLCNYGRCFSGDGKCTSEGTEIKGLIPESTQNSCAKCTDKQKHMVAKMIQALQEKCPEEWAKINKQVDPNGARQDELKKFLSDYSH